MDFEPLEEELEEYLTELTDKAQDGALNTPGKTPELKELVRLGYIEVVSEYIDGTSLVRLTYKAIKYDDRKKKWKKEKRANAAKGFAEKVGDKAVDIAASVLTKGM